jgi:hypothetical protein
VLTYRSALSSPSLTLCGSLLHTASEIRDLGIRYSCTLNFTQQALYQTAKARRLCFLILHSFNLPLIKLALYKQCIRPILEYCPVLFTHYTQSDRYNIERVQRMFTKRLLPTGCMLSYRLRCEHFKLDPLWLRRLKLNLRLFHRWIYSQLYSVTPRPIFATFTYNMRDSVNKIKCTISRKAFRHNFFISFYSRIWNKLPEKIRSEESSRLFTISIDNLLSLDMISQLFQSQITIDSLCELGPHHV